MNLTDAMRRALFEHTFGRDQADAGEKAELLRQIGVPEELVAGFCRPGLHAGTTLGGCHPVDAQLVVEQVLFRQRAGSVTIRASHDTADEAGHLKIEVVEVGPPETPAAREGGV